MASAGAGAGTGVGGFTGDLVGSNGDDARGVPLSGNEAAEDGAILCGDAIGVDFSDCEFICSRPSSARSSPSSASY
mgnify:CR=1 FL=1